MLRSNLKYFCGTKGPTGFGSGSTALQVAQKFKDEVQPAGKFAIVTGANSGIGLETARVLAAVDVNVVIACRNVKSGEQGAEGIRKEFKNAKVTVMQLDLSSGASIKKFAEEYLATNQPLHYLINNAGVMWGPKTLTEDGLETQIGTNHFGHFLLTVLLLDRIKSSGPGCRIVSLTSSSQYFAPREGIPLDDLQANKSYDENVQYGISKLANILFVRELQHRLDANGESDIIASAVHPGVIRTNLTRTAGAGVRFFLFLGRFTYKTIPQGAATTMVCTLHPSIPRGRLFFDCNVAKIGDFMVHPMIEDDAHAKQLWETSEAFWKSKGFL